MYNISLRVELAMSLYDLLTKTPMPDLSVRQICRYCGCSTRTFYNYFRDKYDLMHFMYYYFNELCWYEDGKPLPFITAYDRFSDEHMISLQVFRNMYQYVGQNDIREFSIRKTAHDIRKMFFWNGHPELLEQERTQELVTLVSHGLTSIAEHSAFSPGIAIPSSHNVLYSFPEPLRDVIMEDPAAEGPRPDIPVFDPPNCEWPPKLLEG